MFRLPEPIAIAKRTAKGGHGDLKESNVHHFSKLTALGTKINGFLAALQFNRHS